MEYWNTKDSVTRQTWGVVEFLQMLISLYTFLYMFIFFYVYLHIPGMGLGPGFFFSWRTFGPIPGGVDLGRRIKLTLKIIVSACAPPEKLQKQ